jgi:hypothetical protein
MENDQDADCSGRGIFLMLVSIFRFQYNCFRLGLLEKEAVQPIYYFSHSDMARI